MKTGSLWLGAASLTLPAGPIAAQQIQERFDYRNPTGISRTVKGNGRLDSGSPFFQSLGTNGRSCATCHMPADGWSVSASNVRLRFELTKGTDPIFRTVDGANSPLADVSTVPARRAAYSMLLSKGVFRVERPIPANAEFELAAVDDPYGYASAAGLSLFRRPLPTTNLRFISTVMWDGREVDPSTPMKIENSPQQNFEILWTSLAHQALDATNGHAQALQEITMEQRNAIVDFEIGLATAQIVDNRVGSLMELGALGGPGNILRLPFYIGINDNVNDPRAPFNPAAMTLFDSWAKSSDANWLSVVRGQALFNTLPIEITDVNGINDNPYFGSPTKVVGTCTTCHDTPNIGNHSLAIALNIGLSDARHRSPDMPLYTLRNKTTGELKMTTDPGLALGTGKWKDIGRFKGPILRGLACRAPYFHDGSAADLGAVLDFYRTRFGVVLKAEQKADLIAFLQSL